VAEPHPSLIDRLHPAVRTWFAETHGEFTQAQELAIPHILRGESVLLSSPTGSGKTLAGFLGIISALAEQADAAPGGELPNRVLAVYVSPLRALTYDISKNLLGPLQAMGLAGKIRVAVRTGDTPASERAKFRRTPPHIFLTTPESLAIILSQANQAELLAHCRYVVIDEIHAMAENKRGGHLALSLERLERLAARQRGTPEAVERGVLTRIGLSATVAPLEVVAEFLGGVGRPVAIEEAAMVRRMVAEVFSPIRKDPYPPAGWTAGRITRELAQLIQRRQSVILFCNTRSGAEAIGMRMRRELPELADQIEVHHGSLDREVRLMVEDRLKAGELRAAVCSTSLEMGVDIGAVDLVVLIAAPKGVSRTIQRIGRSGHSIHQISHGVLVATNINDLIECAVTCRMVKQRQLDPVQVFEHAFDVVAQHIASMAMAEPIPVEEAWDLIRRALPFRHLPREEFERILVYLEGGGRSLRRQYQEAFGRIVVKDGVIYPAGSKFRQREFLLNIGTIPSEGAVEVKLHGRTLGSVEEGFVKKLRVGDTFVLAGRVLRLVGTGVMEARVERADAALPSVPAWHANKMPLTSGLAREVTGLRTELARRIEGREPDEPLLDWLVETYEISLTNAQAALRHFRLQHRHSLIPTRERLLVELYRAEGPGLLNYFFHTLIGRGANDALSRIVAYRLKERLGGNALVTIDDYGFLLTLQDFQELPLEEWKELFLSEGAEDDLTAALRDSELVKWQFRGVAQTGLMVPRQMPGKQRRLKQVRWNAEILFQVLSTHEPDHPLLRQAYYEAFHTFLNAPAAGDFMDTAPSLDWRLVEVPAVSPFAFGMYVSKIKETMTMEDPDMAIERLYHAMYQRLEGG
jgi:ATP-dependent Lhr-like helicase